jgi:transcriptional regulator NrdR family protein
MSEPQRRRSSSTRSQVRDVRRQTGLRPRVTILKRDGRVQPFSRAKMIASIRNAGATQQEADLVTDRISTRLATRETIPSTEVSSMVARSLSRVNSTASRNYVNTRDRKLAYTQRVSRLSAEITALNQQINSVTHRLESQDDRIQSLPTRIARLRQSHYRLLPHLEADQAALAEAWARVSQELQSTTRLKGELVRTRIQDLQQALTNKMGYSDYDVSNLQDIESGLPGLRVDLLEMQGSIARALSPLEKTFQNIDQDLRKAESTVSILSQASFPWEDGETPIIATKAKDLNNDLDGFITLTNHRFIFESEKEIALKKLLFVVTEKKVVREVVVQKPIGMVTRLVQGKVGFFKGAGLFVEFASESGLPEMKFDTTGQDAAWLTESYNEIISGHVDDELAAAAPAPTPATATPQLVACQICGAPYSERIYRGQTSLRCKYCGAVIDL